MIIWNKKRIPLMYVFFYKLIKENSESNISVNVDCIREIFRRRLNRIPNLYHTFILKEMEHYGLLKKIGNKKNLIYEFKGKDIDKQLNKLLADSFF